MISCGEKKEEYRADTQWIRSRLLAPNGTKKEYDYVIFRNGYNSKSPTVKVEYKGFRQGAGVICWGAEIGETYFVIKLGEVVRTIKHGPK